MQAIQLEDFSCFYKNKNGFVTALDHVTVGINSGELFVIAGESGSGKTTMHKCVLGLCEYMDGKLSINGTSIESLDVKGANIGYVRQEADLYPHLTIYENIAFPLRMIHTAQAEVDRRVKEIAEQLGIRWLLTRKPRQLSGGQQQRVAIAKAMVKNPTILLFDEPFSNVDPELRSELRRMVKQIHQTYQTTMIFVTHDLGEAFSLADRMMVLEQGRIADIGSPIELLENCQSDLLKGFLK